MSLGSRTTKGGAKGGSKAETKDKPKPDKPQPKEKVKPQATTEQLRMANMIDRKNEDASDVRRMVLELMEMTCRTEEEVCSALHDSDNDMVAACNLLLEDTQRIQGEWQTSEKKKKKPPAGNGNGNGEIEPPRDARSRSGPRSRRGDGEGRGRGRGGGSGRGFGRGGRGGGGGRGARRGGGRSRPRDGDSWDQQPTDTGGVSGDTFPTTEDWDNEEWSGSLSDTKVFTPSASVQNTNDLDPSNAQEDWDAVEAPANGPTDHIPTYIYNSSQHAQHPQHAYKLMDQQLSAGSVPEPAPPQEPYHAPHHQPMGMSGTLTAAQSQYLSQLTQQSQLSQQTLNTQQSQLAQSQLAQSQLAQTQMAQSQLAQTQMAQTQMAQSARHDSVYAAPSGYSTTNYVYGSAEIAQRKPQRARVPPPSKIPSTAVEMPGGAEPGGAMFLDVQFGALEPDTLSDGPPTGVSKQIPVEPHPQPQPVPTALEPSPAAAPEPAASYPTASAMLSESLSVVDPTPSSQPVVSEPIVTNSTSLEKQLTASMKQLAVSVSEVASSATTPVTVTPSQHHYTQHHRPKPQPQPPQPQPSSVSAAQAQAHAAAVYGHHAQAPLQTHAHHPAVYGSGYSVPAPAVPTAATAAPAPLPSPYPSTVTLTQYQPVINSYQQTSSSATVYGGNALYTAAAPYAGYQPTQQPKQPKETPQYDNSVSSSNSLTNTTTSQQSSSKAAPTTVTTAGVSNATNAGYAAGTLYGAAGANATYAAYDEAQMMRSTLPHHMGGYYEVGYGVSGAREGTFGLGGGERFGRTDAASPQQVPAAALPPGYAYFYQPPPTTYQYGVYPTYGGGSNVGGVGGAAAGKLSTYAPQQPPYDGDSYKPGGPYNATPNKSGGGAATDLTGAMYAKTHVALNKVNSYEKSGFHSGTPPPFGAGSHLYITAPPHHHAPHHHAPQHQMDVRVNSSHNRRQESQGQGRSAAAKPPPSKPTYSQSYWAPN